MIRLFTHTDLDGIGCAKAAGSQFQSFMQENFIKMLFGE